MRKRGSKVGLTLIAGLIFGLWSSCTVEQEFFGTSHILATFNIKSPTAMEGRITIAEAYLKLDRIEVTGSLNGSNNTSLSHSVPPEEPPYKLSEADSSRVNFSVTSRIYDQLDLHLFPFRGDYQLVYLERTEETPPPAGQSGEGQGGNEDKDTDDKEQDGGHEDDPVDDNNDNDQPAGSDGDGHSGSGEDEDHESNEGDGNDGAGGNTGNDAGSGHNTENDHDDKKNENKGDKDDKKKDKKKDKDKDKDHDDDDEDRDDDDHEDDRDDDGWDDEDWDDEDDGDDDGDDDEDRDDDNDRSDTKSGTGNNLTVDLDHFFQNTKPGMVVFGIYEHNGKVINLIFVATDIEKLTVTARQNDKTSIMLAEKNTAGITFNPEYWFQSLSPAEIEEGTIQRYRDQNVLFIHPRHNADLYQTMVSQIERSMDLRVNLPASADNL